MGLFLSAFSCLSSLVLSFSTVQDDVFGKFFKNREQNTECISIYIPMHIPVLFISRII
jgi:hypothetical protein